MAPVEKITDASLYPGEAERVFAPSSEAELLDILARALSQRIPVTVMGAMTGVTGGAVPQSGWGISLARMNHLQVEPGRAIVGPGVLLRDVQSCGQFYPPDPTENTSSIGGNIAANASGSRSFKFGATRNYVLAMRVALMDGRVLEMRRGDRVDFDVPAIRLPHTTKHSAGYRLAPGMDLIDLFIGSEGTLGIVTQAELKLLPPPGELTGGVVFFKSEEAALDAVDRWRGAGLRMLEYLDAASLAMMDVPQRAALIVEWEGDLDLDMSDALEDESWFAVSASDREKFRKFRHALPERVNDRIRRSGFMKLSTDYAVPIDRGREMLAIYRRELRSDNVIFGHIGDAHLHINTFSSSGAEFESNKALMTELARAAAALGGTVGAEHGLGKRKAHLLAIQYSQEEIESMRAVKRRFDPQWLLGQGTLFSMAADERR